MIFSGRTVGSKRDLYLLESDWLHHQPICGRRQIHQFNPIAGTDESGEIGGNTRL